MQNAAAPFETFDIKWEIYFWLAIPSRVTPLRGRVKLNFLVRLTDTTTLLDPPPLPLQPLNQ